jgi:hypothetical protein
MPGLPQVIVRKASGLNLTAPINTSVSGLCLGGAEVSPSIGILGISFGQIAKLRSVADALAYGINQSYDATNKILVYHHIYRFFKRCPTGVLYIQLVPQRLTLVAAVGATVPFTVATAPAANDKVYLKVGALALLGGPLTLSSGSTSAAATAIAGAINAYTSTSGATASATGANFTVTLPASLGANGNGITPTVVNTGTVRVTGSASSGGVDREGTLPIIIGARATSAYAIGTGSTSGDTWTSSIGSINLLAVPLVLGTLSKNNAAIAIAAAINAYTGTSGCTASTPSGGAFTVTLPLSAGSTLNGTNPLVTETGTIITTVGDVVSIAITNAGSGYTSAPTIAFTGGGGTGAAAHTNAMTAALPGEGLLTLTIGALTDGDAIDIRDSLNYVYATYTFHTLTDTSDNVFAANIKAAFNAAVSTNNGFIAGALVGTGNTLQFIAPATGPSYNSYVFWGWNNNTTTYFTSGAPFVGGTDVVNTVTSITITAAGSGYTSAPTIGFSGGGGTGAAATAIIAGPSTAGTVTGGVTGQTTQAVDQSMMCNPSLPGLAQLLRIVGGDIYQIACVFNPDAQSLAEETSAFGISDDVLAAIPIAQGLANEEFNVFRPIDILLEGRYFSGLATNAPDVRSLASGQVGVVIGSDNDIATQTISSTQPYLRYAAIGDALGCVAQAKVSQSIGATAVFNLTDTADGSFVKPGLSSGIPIMSGNNVNYSDTDLDTLYDDGFIFPRFVVGLTGCFWGGYPTCTLITNDDSFGEYSRTLNEAARLIRQSFLLTINANVTLDESDGTIVPTQVASLEANAESYLDRLLANGDTSGPASVTIIQRDQDGNAINFTRNGSVLNYVATILIKGVIREINGTVALTAGN